MTRKVFYSDVWYTPEELLRHILENWGSFSDGVAFDPTTDVEAMRRLPVFSFTDPLQDFLLVDDKYKIVPPAGKKLSNISLQNPPYSKESGGAAIFVRKHLELCKNNDLISIQLLNAATGAKWFHEILDILKKEKRKYVIGIVKGRIAFETTEVSYKLDGVIQEPCILPALSKLQKENANITDVVPIGITTGKSPRYDNLFLVVAPNNTTNLHTKSFTLPDDFNHEILWIQPT
jgi:hypothetical protein